MALYIVSILIFIVCILLILVVLVQNSKGGGLTSTFASSNQVLGVKKTADFLEKTTWTMAVLLLVLTLSTVFFINSGTSTQAGDNTKEILENANTAPINLNQNAAQPATGTQTPQTEQPTQAAPAEDQGAKPE